jgi:antitoxin YefM
MNQTINCTKARANLYRLIDEVSLSHNQILITGKEHNAVLVSEEDWASIQESLYLLSIPGMRQSIIEGLNAGDDEFSNKIDW